MKKTVWVINQFAGHPESGWGERHFYFARIWKELGWNVVIISGSFNHVFRHNTEMGRQTFLLEEHGGIPFLWIKTPKYRATSVKRFYSMLVFAWRCLRLHKRHLPQPDAIIVSSMPIFPVVSGRYLANKFKSVFLFEIRDIWPLTLQLLGGYGPNHPAVRFIGWFEKFGYRKADTVVSLLPNAAPHIDVVAGKPVDFAYVPNGIEPDLMVQDSIDDALYKALPRNKFTIGYAGTIGLANALEYLIDASAMFLDQDEVHFVVVGDGYLKNELVEKTRQQKNITFWPKIRKNQVQDLLKHFDVCFVGRNDSPLFVHGVSANKYFDYMLAGKPILDSNNLIKDPVELSGCGIIVKPDSTEAIVDGLRQMLAMTDAERKAMGQKGREFVLQHHSIRHLAEEYLKLFSK